MDFANIKAPAIIICPSSIKRDLVKEKTNNCPLLNVKFIDKGELMEGAFYGYDYETIYKIHVTFGYPLDNAEEILKNAYFVGGATEKMKEVARVKKYLKEHNLLKLTPHFAELFKNKNTYVYGYSSLDEELKKVFKALGINPTYIENKYETVKRKILNFKDIQEEITYVINEICKLHKKDKVSLNNIFLYSPTSDYLSELNKLSHFFGIPMELGEKRRLFDSPILKKFLELLKDNSIEDAYEKIKEDTKVDTYDAVGRIANCINEAKFLSMNKDEFTKLFSYIAKKTNLKSIHYEESIKVVDSNFTPSDKDYVFAMGFSLGEYPNVARDRDFYLDEEKEVLGLNNSKTTTKINEESLIAFLNKTKNLTLTRRKKNGKEKYYDSLLKAKLGYDDEKGEIPDECYSEEYAKLLVGKALDLKDTYGIDSKHRTTYTEKELKYKTFDHEYSHVYAYGPEDKLRLSYSQIQEYNKCPYQYFLKRVLKLQAFEDTFSSKLGSLFHKIIEEGVTTTKTKKDYEQEILDTFQTESERYFINSLIDQAFEVAALNREFHDQTTLSDIKAEESKVIKLSDNVYLTGKVDKAMIDKNSKLIAVVDYKTGKVKIEKSLVEYGLSLQLPLYALMLKDAYKDYKIAGLYIQNVLEDPHDKESLGEYKLKGLTINDDKIVKKLDSGLGTRTNDEGEMEPSSKYIDGVKVNKDGLIGKTGTVEESVFDELAESAKEAANIASKRILNGDFMIRPLVKDEYHDNPCVYCPCNDICLKKGKDSIDLQEYKEQYEACREDYKRSLEQSLEEKFDEPSSEEPLSVTSTEE